MSSRPIRAIPIVLAILSLAAIAVSCSKKGSTAPNNTVTGPTFSLDFPATGPGGTSQQLTFTDVGTWAYHCIAHGSNGGPMTGTVVVDPASTSDSAFVQVGPGNTFSFSPASVTIHPNGHVRWQNASGLTNHTVTRP